MGITIHRDFEQNSEEWYAARNGILTASELKLIITAKTLKPANNDKMRAHAFEIAAQRINGPRLDEESYQSWAMMRGHEEEELARNLYIEHFDNVEQVGFITNDDHGFTLGYSPDGIVQDDGLIECKSRDAKFQVQTAHEYLTENKTPDDYFIQLQGGLMISGRNWIDLLSYSNGMDMIVMRVERDPVIEEAILAAADVFEKQVAAAMDSYYTLKRNKSFRTIPTTYKKRELIL